MRTITVLYKCACMPSETSIEIVERRQDEDVRDYMRHVLSAIAVAHRNRSPLCLAEKMDYAMIPVESDEGIGFARGGNA